MKPTTASTIPVHCSYLRLADVASIVPHPKNPNKHGDTQVALLAKIIKHQGWRSPITISKRSGFVVAGHGRLQAAALLQVEQVPVDEQEFSSEADELAHLVADNRIAELAKIDYEELSLIIEELEKSSAGYDFGLLGMTTEEISMLLDSEWKKEPVNDTEPTDSNKTSSVETVANATATITISTKTYGLFKDAMRVQKENFNTEVSDEDFLMHLIDLFSITEGEK